MRWLWLFDLGTMVATNWMSIVRRVSNADKGCRFINFPGDNKNIKVFAKRSTKENQCVSKPRVKIIVWDDKIPLFFD